MLVEAFRPPDADCPGHRPHWRRDRAVSLSARADVATLLELLDACVAHHEGPETLALVASVRTQAARRNWAALAGPLGALEPARMVPLVRACLAYFHAANIAEQVHRADELACGPARPGWRR